MDVQLSLTFGQHYPKTKRYISLFPPEVRQGEPTPAPESSETNQQREETLNWVREQMRSGRLPAEPEMESTNDVRSTHPSRTYTSADNPKTKKANLNGETRSESSKDDFFASDGEDGSDSEGSDSE